MDTTFNLANLKSVPLTTVASDANGTVVEGITPSMTVSDETIATLETAADGTVSLVRVAQTSGTVVVTATVTNADGSTATGTLTVSLDAVTTGALVVTDIEIVPGTPV